VDKGEICEVEVEVKADTNTREVDNVAMGDNHIEAEVVQSHTVAMADLFPVDLAMVPQSLPNLSCEDS
jgi:hypothetical protein